MTGHDHSPARRGAIKAPAIGLGAGIAANLLPAAARAPSAAAAPAERWSSEYWSKKGVVELNPWRKRLCAPQRGEAASPIFSHTRHRLRRVTRGFLTLPDSAAT